jgi:hypothetical protein
MDALAIPTARGIQFEVPEMVCKNAFIQTALQRVLSIIVIVIVIVIPMTNAWSQSGGYCSLPPDYEECAEAATGNYDDWVEYCAGFASERDQGRCYAQQHTEQQSKLNWCANYFLD